MNISTAVEKIITLHKLVPDTLYDTITHQTAIAQILEQLLADDWIRGEDQLPGHGDFVLVYDDQSERVWFAEYFGDFVSTDSDGEWPCSNLTITHWKPLPELPKEVGDESNE